MFARASSLEPFLVLACLIGFALLWLWRSRRQARQHPAREPKDLSAHYADTFIIKPYVQLGNASRQADSEHFELLWHARPDPRHRWLVQYRVRGQADWKAAAVSTEVLKIAAIGESEHSSAVVRPLPAGANIEYRVLCDGDIAFESAVFTRNPRGESFRFAVAGDLGEPDEGHEQKIAFQMHRLSPRFVVVPGDIVYERGRISEFVANFFPVYNADSAGADLGAPILRSTLMIGAVGNHDVGMPKAMMRRDFTRYPDLLGYYVFFSQPLNGPGTAGGVNIPFIEGDHSARKVFLKAAGERYPRMANFSFDWGDSHWLVLDANAYMDWTNAAFRDWVARDLAAAKDARWKFVTFHQPSFSSDRKHSNEQRMRLLAPLFETAGVDVVFVGHVHCYERSRPLRFTPHKLETRLHTEECAVEGDFEIDTAYDGVENRRPTGVIYVTSGAGGALIHRESDPGTNLKPYTAKYDQRVHSFTICDLSFNKLEFRQINEEGVEIDRFAIEK